VKDHEGISHGPKGSSSSHSFHSTLSPPDHVPSHPIALYFTPEILAIATWFIIPTPSPATPQVPTPHSSPMSMLFFRINAKLLKHMR